MHSVGGFFFAVRALLLWSDLPAESADPSLNLLSQLFIPCNAAEIFKGPASPMQTQRQGDAWLADKQTLLLFQKVKPEAVLSRWLRLSKGESRTRDWWEAGNIRITLQTFFSRQQMVCRKGHPDANPCFPPSVLISGLSCSGADVGLNLVNFPAGRRVHLVSFKLTYSMEITDSL